MKSDLFLFFTILLNLFTIDNDINDSTEKSNQFDIIFKDRQHCNYFLKLLRVIPCLLYRIRNGKSSKYSRSCWFWQETCNAVERNFPISIFNSLLVAGATVDSNFPGQKWQLKFRIAEQIWLLKHNFQFPKNVSLISRSPLINCRKNLLVFWFWESLHLGIYFALWFCC